MEFSALLLRFVSFGVLVICSSGSVNVPVGEFVQYKIEKIEYASDTSLKDLKVSFNFTTEDGYPELPSWLRLEQRDDAEPAYLYGAPSYMDKSAVIEIIGWDKSSYSTKREVHEFDVIPGDFPWFQAEFLITNMNLDKFLEMDTKTKILKIVKDKYWSADDLVVTGVESALDRGGRIPLPNSNKHEGVYVRVGSRKSWDETGANSSLQTGQAPSTDYFALNDYAIKWSNFSFLDLRTFASPAAQREALLPEDKIIPTAAYEPPEFDDSPRDFDHDFILVVVIPIIFILIFVLVLSIIMCCGREGRRKRDQQTAHIKLTHHHNIQRSTMRLRELSKHHKQEQSAPHTPASQGRSRPGHGHGDSRYERVADDHDDDGPEQRYAPPPYRMPPESGASAGAQQV